MAAATVAGPLLLREIIDRGILARNVAVIIEFAAVVAVVVALLTGALAFVNRWSSARIGAGLIYDLRTQVFDRVQRQSVTFFTRVQTGSLVSRLDGDVVGAQQAITSVLSGIVSNVISRPWCWTG
jgi:ATP-binding cassette subfamily B protein